MREPLVSAPREVFIRHTNRLVRHARADLAARRAAAGLFFGLLPASVLALAAGSVPVPVSAPVLAGCLAAAGLLAGAVSGLLGRIDRRGVLIGADRALESRELTSTALELCEAGRDGVFADAVVQAAAGLLSRNTPRRILGRLRLPFAPFIALLAAVTAACLLFPVDLRFLFRPDGDRLAELASIGEQLQGYGERLREDERAEGRERSLALSEELAQLGKDLADRRLTEEEALDRMSELEDRIEQEYRLQMEEVARPGPDGRPGSTQPGGAGGQKVPGEAERDAKPGDGSGGGQRRKDLGDALDQLRESRRQLESGDASSADRRPEDPRKGQAGSGQLPPGGDSADQTPGGQKGTDPQSGGRSRGPESQGQQRAGPGDAPGTTPAPHKTGDPTRIIPGERGPGLQAEGKAGEGDSTRLLARTLPDWTGSRLPEGAVLNQYSRQAESALARDEVPLQLKEYVKDYFTAIGIAGRGTGR